MMIKPTVGRVVLYWPPGSRIKDHEGHPEPQPRVAFIAYVHGDRMINIGFFDQNGVVGDGATSVLLVQEGDDTPGEFESFCEWMPFQIGQAKVHDRPPTIPSGRQAQS